MPTINPEIIEYAERNDSGGILRCLAKGNPIDEQRKVCFLFVIIENRMVVLLY